MLCLVPVAHPHVAVGRSVVFGYGISRSFKCSDMFEFRSIILENIDAHFT